MLRGVVVTAIGALLLSACSGSDRADPTPTAPVATPAPPTTAPVEVDNTPTSPPTTAQAEPAAVMVEVVAPDAGIDGGITVDLIEDDSTLDPFGRFAACSGLRDSVATYSVVISDPESAIRGASLSTTGRIDGSGSFESELRMSSSEGAPVVAAGTMVIDGGLRSGSFTGFDLGGEPVSGSFVCSGPGGPPTPLRTGIEDGVLETVEVSVLLSSGGFEQVVGLAVDTEAGSADASCPSASGAADGALVVRVDGGPAVGSLSTFELTTGDRATMRMRVGAAVYEFVDLDVMLAADGSSGSFIATSTDGVQATGAFSCT